MSSQLVWLITGTSSGIGRELTVAALKRGDKVIATSRARADILYLDVTDPLEKLQEAAKKAIAIHGRVDVLVNNAGAIEESTLEETYEQLQTNVFSALNVTSAFLPYMRQKKSGTVVFVGSLGGWRSVPNLGIYASTKFALRGVLAHGCETLDVVNDAGAGISETLHEEISPLGLRSTCIDLGYFRTSLLGAGQRVPYEPRIDDYKLVTKKAEASLQAANGKQPGSPEKGVNVIIDVVKNEGVAKGKAFPTSLALGSDCYETIKTESEKNLRRLEEWKDISFSTDF